MTTTIRRPITPAASAPARHAWRAAAACLAQHGDEFYSDDETDLDEARQFCLPCPVITDCLKDVVRRESGRRRWGMQGGLTPTQRYGLEWEQRLHGHTPDLDAARLLVSDRWRDTTWVLGGSATLDESVAWFRDAGLDVDTVTVRVALWWVGRSGTRVPFRTGLLESESRRLIRLCTPVIRELRALGAVSHGVAAYLGAPASPVRRAVQLLEKTDSAVLEATEMGMAA